MNAALAPAPPLHTHSIVEALIALLRPSVPDEDIDSTQHSSVLEVVRRCVGRWYSPLSAEATPIVHGLAGIVAARTNTGPRLLDADQTVREALNRGEQISVLTGRVDLVGGAQLPDEASTSFVQFLIERFGVDALRRFLAAYEPGRPDAAAQLAWQRPLGVLEEAWLATVRRPVGSQSVLQDVTRHLLPMLRPYWNRQLEVVVYMLFEMACGLALPLATGKVVDSIISGTGADALAMFAFLLVMQLSSSVLGMRRAYVTSWINDHVRNDLESRLFAHLQHLSHDFYGRSKIGDITARLSGDLDAVRFALAQLTGVGIALLLRSVAAAVAIVVLNPLLGSLLVLTIPVTGVTYYALRGRLQAASVQYQHLAGEVAAAAQENLSAHGVIKAFNLEEHAVASYTARLREKLGVGLRLAVLGSLFETTIGVATTLTQMLVLALGGYFVLNGQLTVGTLFAFVGLMPALLQPIALLSNLGQVVQRASGALVRVRDVFDEPVMVRDAPTAVPLAALRDDIRMEGVSFGYEAGRDILRNLDLRIAAGTHVCIVGPSGSGKTTLANLLLRFWDPQTGRVTFDGQDVRDVTLASLRAQIGIVFQDTVMFDTTLRENIAIGRPGASNAEIEAAAHTAQLSTYVASLSARYDTLVGDRGVRMSGGQRQRVALARALLRVPSLLILDEATSALDTQTERDILDTLAGLACGRTIVSVTHRLSLASTADHIVVLDDGRIVQQGTHAELLTTGGLYQRMHAQQSASAVARGTS